MYGICNVVGASIPRNTDSGTYIHVGPEIGVASTKAFTGQVTVLMLLALCVGQMRGTVDDATVERIVRELKNMPLYIKDVLGLADKIKNLSKIYTYARNFLYLGRGYNYPTALEGALKLKEISYIHAEGYPAAEMKLYNFADKYRLFILILAEKPNYHAQKRYRYNTDVYHRENFPVPGNDFIVSQKEQDKRSKRNNRGEGKPHHHFAVFLAERVN